MKLFRVLVLVLVALAPARMAAARGGMTPLPPPVVESTAPAAPEASPSRAAETPAQGASHVNASPPAASPPAEASAGASPAADASAATDSAPSPDASPEGSPEPDASPSAAPSASGSPAPSASPRARPRMAPGFAPRGAIRDVSGKALVSDGPCWDIGVRFEVVSAKADPESDELQKAYLAKLALQVARAPGSAEGPSPERLAKAIFKKVAETWAEIRAVSGLTDEELVKRAERSVAAVERMKAAVKRASGQERQIAEERSFRTVARVYGAEAGKRLTEKFKTTPWVRLTASVTRFSEDTEALVHVLGQVGKADARRVTKDALAADPDRALVVGDSCGISGAERLGDAVLRPWVDQAGAPHPGADVTLTVDAALQKDTYRILEAAVKKSVYPCGGAAVVIHVPTGEVRALVSYPAHAYDLSSADAVRFSDDSKWTPMRFRAVSSQFPPGSTIKPVTLYTALAESAVTSDTKVTCTGTFKKEVPDSYRCWIFNKTGGNHGVETGETALRDSCNIYFYTAGDKLGAAPLIKQFARFGVGITQGTGLIEESDGILPTPEWLATHRKKTPKYQRVDGWAYAFGQGELTVTPLGMANIAATLSRGRYQRVTLMKNAKGERIGGTTPEMNEVLDGRWLETVRRGLWRVVNEKGGTADVAKLDIKSAVLCGKTGSAQAVPRVVTRRFTFDVAGKQKSVDAPTQERAKAMVGAGAKLVGSKILERYPVMEEDELPSHAWFIGYTQDPKTPRGGAPIGDSYAISVLVEYGGAGGAVASPIARDIARRIYAKP